MKRFRSPRPPLFTIVLLVAAGVFAGGLVAVSSLPPTPDGLLMDATLPRTKPVRPQAEETPFGERA